ncbi:MAG TPA: hypothetical protein VD907_01285 [Verrucomicrobiae bacterium]|nr:hypothetical protein [Verrucomicrobiae bacterium]
MNLGLWAPFIDVTGVKSWYGGFPEKVENALRTYTFTSKDFDPIPVAEYNKLLKAAEAFADKSVARLKLPDHNPEHFEDVRRNVLQAFDKHYGAKAKGEYLAVRQMLEIAAYCHDCYHCGSTLRADAEPGKLHKPELGTNVSTEWVSALEVTEFGLEHGLPWPKIAFMVAVILATTFGGKDAQQRRISNVPIVEPAHPISCMIRAADVALKSDFMKFIVKGINVNVRETPSSGKVESYDVFVTKQLGFIDHYVMPTFKSLNQVAGTSLTTALGWDKVAMAHKKNLQRMIDNEDPGLIRKVKQELAKVGVTQ